MDEIENKIGTYIAQEILFTNKEYPYPPETSFLENGIVDSMNVLGLVMFVEENFDITVEDDEIIPDNFDSVRKLANYIRSKKMRLHASSPIP